MFKLIKYEFRKNLTVLLVILGILVGLEINFLISAKFLSEGRMASGAGFLFVSGMVCYFLIFVFGIQSYSKELSNKSSYLVFMTPNSALKIILSKLLYTLFIGILVLAIFILFAIPDVKLWGERMNVGADFFELLAQAVNYMFGLNLMEIMYGFLGSVFTFLIWFFLIVTLAYLGITLSATVLQNKKGKGFVSVIIFIAAMYIVVKIGEMLPVFYDGAPKNMQQALMMYLPCTLFYLLIIVLNVFGCARLLEKRVSL